MLPGGLFLSFRGFRVALNRNRCGFTSIWWIPHDAHHSGIFVGGMLASFAAEVAGS